MLVREHCPPAWHVFLCFPLWNGRGNPARRATGYAEAQAVPAEKVCGWIFPFPRPVFACFFALVGDAPLVLDLRFDIFDFANIQT